MQDYTESDTRNKLGLHPIAEPENTDIPEDVVKDAIDIIIDRATPQDHLVFMTPEGLRSVHLAFTDYDKTQNISLMFKRSPEMKVYYPKIRKWFETEKLEWRDSRFKDERYMRSDLILDRARIHRLIQSAQDNIFNVEAKRVSAINSHALHSDLVGLRYTMLTFIGGVGFLASTIILPMYEVYKLNTLASPSISALDWTEPFLMIMFFSGLAALRFSIAKNNRSDSTNNSKKNWKIYLARLGALSVIALAFFTY